MVFPELAPMEGEGVRKNAGGAIVSDAIKTNKGPDVTAYCMLHAVHHQTKGCGDGGVD